MNPQAYDSTSLLEMQPQMTSYADTPCTLSSHDLGRIDKLPSQVSLALPFLHTKEEMEAHRLLNKYYRNSCDEGYEKEDARTFNHGTHLSKFYLKDALLILCDLCTSLCPIISLGVLLPVP